MSNFLDFEHMVLMKPQKLDVYAEIILCNVYTPLSRIQVNQIYQAGAS
jgi:hypothetical protein